MPPGVSGRHTAPIKVPDCKTYYPTWEEFKDFKSYIDYLEREEGAHLSGVVKVVPPKEWVPRKSGYNLDDFNYEIAGPIKQHFKQVGARGCYQTKGIVQQKTTVKEYEKMANSNQFKPPNHCSYEDLERKYWKTLSFCPPIYGCDVADSITDEDQDSWNIRDLKTILNLVNEDYDQEIKGVNSPYLYFGMWKATFSWHVEDMDLHSINYLHYGAPKTWYVVPPRYGYLMEKAARELFPNVASWCSNFMRHKTCLISPNVLDKLGVPYQKVVQEERNAIIVFPYAYHSGFNHGFNIAESTNFALERWIEYGKRARQCDCTRSRVTFSMDTFVKRFQPEKYDDWKSGKDIAPHPEDPLDVREEIMLRANNPAEYAKMMQERLWLGDKTKKRAKPRNTCPLPEKGDEGPTKTYKVYQHHEMKQAQVTINPVTMKCIRGLQRYKDILELDSEPDFQDLISTGILIHVQDEVVKVKRPREIMSEVTVFEHKDQPTMEAVVDPISLKLMGEQSPQLLDYLGHDKQIRDEIQRGNFVFKLNAKIFVPNPHYAPEQHQEPEPKKRKPDSIETPKSDVVIQATIYQHRELNEFVTLTEHRNVIGSVSASMVKALDGLASDDLLASKTLVKVGVQNIYLTGQLSELERGQFLFGEDDVNVDVAAAKNSVVFRLRTEQTEATNDLKVNTLNDLVNSGIMKRIEGNADDEAALEIMMSALLSPCYISKCPKHQDEKRTVTNQGCECGCAVEGQGLVARKLGSDGDLIVIVDDVSDTVVLVFGPETLIVKRGESVQDDLLDPVGEVVPEEVADESDEDAQAFTSDEEQEQSDVESSDDPDFTNASFNNYSWKHSGLKKKRTKRTKDRKRERSPRKRKPRVIPREKKSEPGVKRSWIKANVGYETYLTIARKILEHVESKDSEADELIVPSDLALAIQYRYTDIVKMLEILKLFEVMELVDPTEQTYQFVSRDQVRLAFWLRRIYNEDVDSADDIDTLSNVIRGIVKHCLEIRRVSFFF